MVDGKNTEARKQPAIRQEAWKKPTKNGIGELRRPEVTRTPSKPVGINRSQPSVD